MLALWYTVLHAHFMNFGSVWEQSMQTPSVVNLTSRLGCHIVVCTSCAQLEFGLLPFSVA